MLNSISHKTNDQSIYHKIVYKKQLGTHDIFCLKTCQ